jgi:hypothetical protein
LSRIKGEIFRPPPEAGVEVNAACERTPEGRLQRAREFERTRIRGPLLAVLRETAESLRFLADTGDLAAVAELRAVTDCEAKLLRLASKRSA